MRNGESRQQKLSRTITRYSRTQPPPDVEVAGSRIDQLVLAEQRIQAQLDNTGPEDFATDEDFERWKSSAMGAIGHIRAERKFLERWIEAVNKPPKVLTRSQFSEVVAGIREQARAMAAPLLERYGTGYTQQCEPPNMEAARARFDTLVILKTDLQSCLVEVTAEWASHPLRKQAIGIAKDPLSKIMWKVEKEIVLLRGYIRRNDVNTGDWWPFLFGLVERALANGFILTPEERPRFDAIAEHHRRRTSIKP